MLVVSAGLGAQARDLLADVHLVVGGHEPQFVDLRSSSAIGCSKSRKLSAMAAKDALRRGLWLADPQPRRTTARGRRCRRARRRARRRRSPGPGSAGTSRIHRNWRCQNGLAPASNSSPTGPRTAPASKEREDQAARQQQELARDLVHQPQCIGIHRRHDAEQRDDRTSRQCRLASRGAEFVHDRGRHHLEQRDRRGDRPEARGPGRTRTLRCARGVPWTRRRWHSDEGARRSCWRLPRPAAERVDHREYQQAGDEGDAEIGERDRVADSGSFWSRFRYDA